MRKQEENIVSDELHRQLETLIHNPNFNLSMDNDVGGCDIFYYGDKLWGFRDNTTNALTIMELPQDNTDLAINAYRGFLTNYEYKAIRDFKSYAKTKFDSYISDIFQV